MRKLSGFLFLTALLSLAACKGHEKKILVYASSDIKVDDTKQNITVTEGTTHHEQELDFTTGNPVTLDVQSPAGKLSVTASDDGLYILNLKPDTVVGTYEHVGTAARNDVSQDEAKHAVDSLQKLVMDKNVNEANRNYFIAPGKMVKVTAEPKAKVFGPYTSIPGSFDAGSVPEIYKFYSVSEIRDIIEKLQKATK
ncbi:MAG TPA: hypothetical protein VFE32_07090 [Puia sp.]|jgi:hypothetical protein|nr:hypothetical protein [Puia sp.]